MQLSSVRSGGCVRKSSACAPPNALEERRMRELIDEARGRR
jgi:hypothetical protein